MREALGVIERQAEWSVGEVISEGACVVGDVGRIGSRRNRIVCINKRFTLCHYVNGQRKSSRNLSLALGVIAMSAQLSLQFKHLIGLVYCG